MGFISRIRVVTRMRAGHVFVRSLILRLNHAHWEVDTWSFAFLYLRLTYD